MEESPFTDVGRDDPLFEKLVALAKTRAIVFTDNKLRLDDKMTVGELAMLLAPRDEALSRRVAQLRKTGKAGPLRRRNVLLPRKRSHRRERQGRGRRHKTAGRHVWQGN